MALLACLWVSHTAHAEIIALRCPWTSMAIESLYDIDLEAGTVQLANPGGGWTLPATIDATYITWQDPRSRVLFRVTRASGELMSANTADGPWEMMSFCVPRQGN